MLSFGSFVGGAITVLYGLRVWLQRRMGAWLWSFAVMLGFMALAFVGIMLTLIGPQQI